MPGIGQELLRHDRGKMFQYHRRRQIGDLGPALGHGQRFDDALLDPAGVIAIFLDPAVQRQMFAAVDHFLLDEGADFLLQLWRCLVAKLLDALDEKSLAAREGEGQAIVEGGRHRVAILPIFVRIISRVPAETAVAGRDFMARWRRRVNGFRGSGDGAKHIHRMLSFCEMQTIANSDKDKVAYINVNSEASTFP